MRPRFSMPPLRFNYSRHLPAISRVRVPRVVLPMHCFRIKVVYSQERRRCIYILFK
jgi:hypothetical protein